ncbi:hypothetical protein MMYC01_208083 [Madurella mycetomatis]|uniref:DNA replication factor Cdt1 C-terminal domain-containing protein n=1 Tax=Madurella mycetomatis TaxID=100816 RepID=A0A175VY88_9PEZI|nr:hypothetical protein MMYC01_209414 [Madurella mycetomatis]KXX76498.1 hypothetical protein MMYC01_208083 [Madurella mycetomatis]
MPGVISRKTRTPRGKLASTNPPASNVSNFSSKVSKVQSVGKESAGKPTGRTSSIEIILTSRKRRVEDDGPSTPKKLRREPQQPQRTELVTPVSRKKKTVTFAEPENVPPTLSCAAPASSSSRKRQFQSDETIQAEVLLERLNLQSPVRNKRAKTTVDRRSPQNDFDLPQDLLDLLDLHVAFLKTLTMQYAHNGTNSPIDLRTLYPSVTRAWGKRQVTLDDIQRMVGVLSWMPVKNSDTTSQLSSPFFLSDYGRNKICVELHSNAEPGPLREHKLNMDFESNLRTLWLSRREPTNTTLFIATLPKAAIKPCPSLAKSNPLQKHQRTFDELKSSIALKKQEKESAKAAALNPDGSSSSSPLAKLSLVERIRLKEQAQANQQGPDAAELQRRAALQRAEDVAAMIGMLCKASGQAPARMSFTMTALMVRLKDSSRTPISGEDGAACVRLLAAEVAPQWLRIVKLGERENVVVQPALQPSKGVVQERVKALLG